MDFAAPSSSSLRPRSNAFDAASLSMIEALEPAALLSLVSFKLNVNGADLSDWNAPSPTAATRVVTDEESSPQLPPKKRIHRKWIIETQAVESESNTAAAAVPESTVPSTLYADGDEEHINPIHNILRRDILEVFMEVPREPKTFRGAGRKANTIKARHSRFAGRLGLRCRFCKHLPAGSRPKLATIYPETLEGIYRACNIRFQKRHLGSCQHIPEGIRDELGAQNKSSRGSKSYWVESALRKGFRNSEDSSGIIYCPEIKS